MTEAKALLELQEIDLQILRLNSKLEKLPEKDMIRRVRDAKKQLQLRQNKAVGLRKDAEMDLKGVDDEKLDISRKVEYLQGLISETEDAKVLQAINTEISNHAKRFEKIEFDQVARNKRIEEIKETENEISDTLRKLNATEVDIINKYRLAGATIQKEISDFTKARAQVLPDLSDENIDLYEAKRQYFGGIAVAQVKDSACTGCGGEFKHGQLDELRSGGDISICPSCRRILIVR